MIYELLALGFVCLVGIAMLLAFLWSMQNFNRRARNPCIKDVKRECTNDQCCQMQDARERLDKFLRDFYKHD